MGIIMKRLQEFIPQMDEVGLSPRIKELIQENASIAEASAANCLLGRVFFDYTNLRNAILMYGGTTDDLASMSRLIDVVDESMALLLRRNCHCESVSMDPRAVKEDAAKRR